MSNKLHHTGIGECFITTDGRVVKAVGSGSCGACVFWDGAACKKQSYLAPGIPCWGLAFEEVKDDG